MTGNEAMKWLRGRRAGRRGRRSGRRRLDDGSWEVDVRGQTCPGYLLDIDRHVAAIGRGRRVVLRISYPPCEADVRAWCREKGHDFVSVEAAAEGWRIFIRT